MSPDTPDRPPVRFLELIFTTAGLGLGVYMLASEQAAVAGVWLAIWVVAVGLLLVVQAGQDLHRLLTAGATLLLAGCLAVAWSSGSTALGAWSLGPLLFVALPRLFWPRQPKIG